MKILKFILAAPMVMLISPTISAGPASVDIRVTASVPVSCSASLDRNVVEISANSFKIGQLNRFCNTPHMVTVGTVSGIDGTVHLEGQSASTITGQAVVNPLSSAKRGRADIFLSGVTRSEADNIARSLSVTLSPAGI